MLRTMLTRAAAALTAAASLCSAGTLYTNATIYTANDGQPTAAAMHVVDGVIKAIGPADEVLGDVGDEIVDLSGAVIVPGFIDAHGHVTGLGQLSAGVLDLSGTKSYQEVLDRVAARVADTPEGDWIIGRGWDHESWFKSHWQDTRPLPEHGPLTEISPANPVVLYRVDGHALLANAEAMRRAQVTRQSVSPEGGAVVRDERGDLSGVFIDNAESLVDHAIPSDAIAGDRELILTGQQRCLEVGLTSVHDMGLSPQQIILYQLLESEQLLKLRVYGLVSGPHAMRYFENNDPYIADPLMGGRFGVKGCKLYMDGALGSRGAWLLAPYEDMPVDDRNQPYTGLNVTDPEEVLAVAEHGIDRGYQVCVHAIGDRANREVLNAFEAAFRSRLNDDPTAGKDLRYRIEHAQVVSPVDFARFGRMGIIPSVQPRHCTSDMRWVIERIGARRAVGAYAWQTFLQNGLRLASGSDFPVEPASPIRGFYAAVTRQNEQGEPPNGWISGQALSRDEALKSFTIWAAEAEFAEATKGSLEPGKVADFVILDRDIMTVEPLEILQTRVLRTVIGGETVFQAD